MIDTATVGYVTLDEFVAVDEPGAEPLAADSDGGTAIPAGGLVTVYGNGGAGKTTLLVDAAFHFAAGQDWLGVSPTRPLCVVWIENEGPRPEFRKKLRTKLEAWGGATPANRFHVYEAPWGAFSFRNDDQRAALVQRLQDTEADMLIVGPVKAVGMQGGGTDDDIGEFLGFVADVQRQTGVTVVLIHHENRAGQISGAWESRPDTLIHVQAQGHGRTRLFWQKCRWSSALHGTASNLLWADGYGFEVEEREQVTDETIAERLLAATLEHGGGSWNTIDSATSGNASDKRRVRDELLERGELIDGNEGGRGMKLWHHEDPARPGASNDGTHLGTHRGSSAGGGGASGVRPASSYIGGRKKDAPTETHSAGPESVQDSLDDAVGF